jgi:hypothetical protein
MSFYSGILNAKFFDCGMSQHPVSRQGTIDIFDSITPMVVRRFFAKAITHHHFVAPSRPTTSKLTLAFIHHSYLCKTALAATNLRPNFSFYFPSRLLKKAGFSIVEKERT